MALPDYFHTAERIIRQALRDAGRLQFGSDPTPEQYEDARDRLADMVHFFQTQGIKLWLNYKRTITLEVSTASYNLSSPRELRVLGGWYVRTDGHRLPLDPGSWQGYNALGDLTQEGQPVTYFVDKQQERGVVYFWPVPDSSAVANGSVELLVQTQVTAPVELDDELNFPIEWYLALRWGLADDLASGQSVQIMERCERKAKEFREKLEDWDVEDAPTQFTPNTTHQRPSRFSR